EVFFFLRDLDLGMSGPSLCCAESSAAAACGSADAGRSHANLAGPTRTVAPRAGSAPIGARGTAAAEGGATAPAAGRSLRPRWGLAVPLVTLVMALLLAMTYASSQGRELRASDAARMSGQVRDAQRGVDTAQERFDALEATIAGRQSALADADEGMAMMLTTIVAEGVSTRTPVSGPGVSVTLTDALRDRE